ncbi:YjaG family protein [Hymenobacter sp. J193]|uniref:YjaG family protein n=1 Tax=Hymenobacter sp. J193 TaxID=2898429 RepID=UPI002151E740|nr:YjaG family protein [Hymenobacter sp. J193]MCR5890968.1 YjaG family protein [Hymenobacter sp. J193]
MDTLVPLLRSLPLTHQAVFAALTCEKMLPSIVRFDETEESPGASIFRRAIDALCAFGAHEPISKDEFAHLQQQLEEFWPDLDESTNPVASYAFDACVALGEALALVQDAEAEHVVQCATAARDTVDMYVQDVTDIDLPPVELNEFIDATPVMQREVARQAATAQVLATEAHLTTAFIDQLRQQNRQEPLIDFAMV